MNQKNLIVLFYLNKAKTNQKGKCPIYCRITYEKNRKQFSTGLFLNPKQWNSKKQYVTPESSSGQHLNIQLELISSKITATYLKLQLKGIEFSIDDVFNYYVGKPLKDKVKLVYYIKEYVAKIKKLIGKDIQMATWKKYNYVCSQIERYVKWKYKKIDIPLGDLTSQFLVDFEYYLKTEEEQSQVTINKAIQRFRKPIKVAVAEGYLDKDPFALHKPRRVKKEVIFLSTEELEKLECHNFSQPRLQLVKDLFVFCCYTGLAYNEMSNLKTEHIIKGFDGNLWIKMKREKTSKMISIPLLPQAKVLLDKYNKEVEDYSLPKFSNQKINSYLKEIADIVGINKSISHHMARKTFASTVLLYNDVPMEIVSELLGHSSMKITQEYYGKVVQKRVSEEIIRLKERNQQ
ncbi:site-specific integrase [Arenibacter sp. TNZ]|uniref:site-specific integrase n=1 Tax=Arenibacter TaxID=178469 RepID=UPI000CD407F3|nr:MULTISPECIES: site-specific integrase [Arenibacter]MCM4172465.1 site-specific integrase [Arenibacter sp. TNZ]